MIEWLSTEQAGAFTQLATTAVGPILRRVSTPSVITTKDAAQLYFAAGIHFAGMPAGLAILRQTNEPVTANISIISLVVAEPCRGLGLATELMRWLQDQGRSMGWHGLSVSYPLEHSCTEAMRKLTPAHTGWEHQLGLRLFHFDRDGADQLAQRLRPAVQHVSRSGRFALIPWEAFPEQRRQSLSSDLSAPAWASPELVAENDPMQLIDPSISTILLDRNQPAGWLIAHQVGATLFRVSQWWVIDPMQGSGIALSLLHQALCGFLTSNKNYKTGTFGMDPNNTLAIQLCQRKISRYILGSNQQCRAQIAFKNP